ncbi:MAG TPA: ankyrin repeat domain-containing protein [Fimbriimonadaceae bacterium]|nr:ankyrin repeat domain-containing protein [Fimbriimonadaceae bacterium]
MCFATAAACVAAASMPWPRSARSQGPERKTTDPPVASTGKLGQDLFMAIDHHDLARVQSLIKKGADPNSQNGLQFTPLYLAAATHQTAAMQALLDAGAKPDAASAYGTPLLFAALTADSEGAKILYDRNVNVNTSRGDGDTVLMMAALSGSPDFVGSLLQRKADVNAKSEDDETALMYAARAGNTAAGKMLMDAGANVNDADSYGQTALMLAAMNGHLDFVEALLERGADPNLRDEKKRTALMLAASYGDYPDVLGALLRKGADPKAADSRGRTAGEIAAAHGYRRSASLLGEATAPVQVRTPKAAILLSLKVVQASTAEFDRDASCISCHQEGLGRMATGAARTHGFKLDEAMLRGQSARVAGALNAMRPLHEQALKSPSAMKEIPLIEINEVSDTDGWLLAGMAWQKEPATPASAAMALVLARQQAPDGSWTFSIPRVPMQSSVIGFTALAVHGLHTYAPKSQAREISLRIRRARSWLLKAPAQTSDDLAFRALGLRWSGASMSQIASATRALIKAQNPDGGWSQAPGLHSDAYATGEALYALHEGGGLSAQSAPYKRGVRFLLRTQDDDGSWFVNKRAIPANNYFDAGFPHGESQYASFNGTCWATMALLDATAK